MRLFGAVTPGQLRAVCAVLIGNGFVVGIFAANQTLIPSSVVKATLAEVNPALFEVVQHRTTVGIEVSQISPTVFRCSLLGH